MLRRRWLPIVSVGLLALFCWGDSQAEPRDEMLELYGLFVDAVERVEANYVQPISRQELLENALRGMLAELDPHSTYFSEKQWAQFRKQIEGTFTGIGISVEMDADSRELKVLAPLPGSPAYSAGILPGDLIVEVDGKPTDGMTRDEAIEALQGRPGTQVTLKVKHLRSDEPEMITVSRAIIELPSVMGDRRKDDDSWNFMLDDENKIGYIRITNFVSDTAEELEAALEDLKTQGMKGLILDLRDDPGGLLNAAVDVSDLFLKDGKIVTTKGRNQRDKVYEAEPEGTLPDFPMAVLVNQHSASASEIVAAALQDHQRAVVIGQRSFGKGSVQNILPLDNGNSILKLTVATYWRPSGRNIHRFQGANEDEDWGVSPDPGMELELSGQEYQDWARARRQRDLISRLNPAERSATEVDEEAPKLHEGIEDKVLDKALQVIAERIAKPVEEPAETKAAAAL